MRLSESICPDMARGATSLQRSPIVAALGAADVLVGHSAGGFDITLAADAVPERVRHLIYLAAVLPLEGRPLIEAIGGATREQSGGRGEVIRFDDTTLSAALRTTAQGRLEWTDMKAARALFYHDCDDDTVSWAYKQLSPAPPGILLEPVSLRSFWEADLPRSYIICLQDRTLSFATAMRTAGRLGVVPLPIDSSHSPFLSHPAELAELLVRSTASRPVAALQPLG